MISILSLTDTLLIMCLIHTNTAGLAKIWRPSLSMPICTARLILFQVVPDTVSVAIMLIIGDNAGHVEHSPDKPRNVLPMSTDEDETSSIWQTQSQLQQSGVGQPLDRPMERCMNCLGLNRDLTSQVVSACP